MAWAGLLMLALALALMMTTGWPTYAVLLGVSTLAAVLGALVGGVDIALLASLPGRVLALLEHDLLQALALYALVGALLQQPSVADDLHGGLRRLAQRVAPRGAQGLTGLALGALLAPMNGSVGASLLTLSHALDRPGDEATPARRTALVAVASTLGVVVPPSMVLLLLGDAMMRAHTEGLNLAALMHLPLAGAGLRVINTQDLLQAVLLPAAALLAGWAMVAAAPVRGAALVPTGRLPWPRRQRITLAVVPLTIATLLTLVSAGRVRAVEAAATAGVALLVWGVVSRQLDRQRLGRALDDAMALTGSLFALLVAAAAFSLLLRMLGTDRLVADAMQRLQSHPGLATLTVMVVLLAFAFVLDAFELIFLVVPIVMPPLLAQVGDAAWVAVITLMVLQAGFLLPPFGYAVVLARGRQRVRPKLAALAGALLPYLVWLGCVIATVAAWPQTTQWLRSAPVTLSTGPAPDERALDDLMRQMARPRGNDTPASGR